MLRPQFVRPPMILMSSYLKFQDLPYTKTQLHSPEDFNAQGILATEDEFSCVKLIKVSYRFSWGIYSRRYATEICTLTKELIWNPSNNFDIFRAVQKDRTRNKTSNSLTCSKRDECAVCSNRLQTKSSINICYKLFSELESHTHTHTHTHIHHSIGELLWSCLTILLGQVGLWVVYLITSVTVPT